MNIVSKPADASKLRYRCMRELMRLRTFKSDSALIPAAIALLLNLNAVEMIPKIY